MIENHSQLYDLLQERFGIGSWDETLGTPWWRARATEVAKLKATMRRRRLSIDDVVCAVEYVERVGIPIREVWQLCEQVGPAKKARAAQARAVQMGVSIADLRDAAAEAYELGEEDWAARLYSAAPSEAPGVLTQWRSRKGTL